MYQTLFTDKKWGKIIFGSEVEWNAFSGTAMVAGMFQYSITYNLHSVIHIFVQQSSFYIQCVIFLFSKFIFNPMIDIFVQ